MKLILSYDMERDHLGDEDVNGSIIYVRRNGL
jgi:hypothetical protein